MNKFSIDTPVITLVGPTAVGKTSLSIKIAKKYNCEIISVDSMQVYKYMDIGTAKITSEEMSGVTHHLLDIITPEQEYDAGSFIQDAQKKIQEIISKKKTPLLTGGTGLYFTSLINGIPLTIPSFTTIREGLKERLKSEGNESLHNELRNIDEPSSLKIHKNDSQRIVRALEIFYGTHKTWSAILEENREGEAPRRFSKLIQICLNSDRDKLYERINSRTHIMLNAGLQNEVHWLLDNGYSADLKSMKSIGYRHMCDFLLNNIHEKEMIETLQRDTRHYAKRQFTWFKKMKGIKWFDAQNDDLILKEIESQITHYNSK